MHEPTPEPPAVVLVHGAFSDASCWAGVVGLLHADGLTVRAPANPLRGLAYDAACLRSVLRRIDVPVVLVGHGYGGAVVTEAATDADNVVALCYVAAFGLDAGECLLDITSRFSPTPAADALFSAAVPAPFPADADSELYIRRERYLHVYAADLPPHVTSVLSVTQRPIARCALTGRSGPPAWAAKPSWYAVATADHVLDPTAQRFMAMRMAATARLVDASHAVPLSQPDAVAAVIREAAAWASTGRGSCHGPRHPFRAGT
ncbi:alpha/beta fold hydrolase [Streptomyces broussonetiae]|uniref:Alpha/beta fold hydrolase n=1 Tax=Streptomyces broussonetiae TaxID=2686304 RepID=A0A6I6MYH4_9ACTN|nr:alpha/beta hydrolase [Streptomyces broussonetiae]QHA03261.1 alpha/beta fold hydrolase [Streptomyces broussonetiae]